MNVSGQVKFDLLANQPDISLTFTFSYVTQQIAVSKNLVYVTGDNKVIMKGDNTTSLEVGQFRDRWASLSH